MRKGAFIAEEESATFMLFTPWWISFRMPRWLLVPIWICLLVLACTALLTSFPLLATLFVVAWTPFFLLWLFDKRVHPDTGRIQLSKRTGIGTFVNKDGLSLPFSIGIPQRIQLERVVVIREHTWRAVLTGDRSSIVIGAGFSFRKSLLRQIEAVAKWLGVAIELSDRSIDGIEWSDSSCPPLNPYPQS
ncbi:MAG: hypothetical protein E6R02_08520 [Gammaproteobacteria bacterium]|nr:MAG: hypothetical protein E6R02_08520 [Gammaproteobacteria bacterium]